MAKYVLAITRDESKLKVRSDEINVLQESGVASSIITDLKDTLRANIDTVALSAPQLGKQIRIFCIKFANGDIRAFVNPMITKQEGLHLTRERAVTSDYKEYIVPRNDRIIATYQTPTGKVEENIFEGVVAEVFQQMVQLLDGVLISDFGLEVIPEFDKATDEERDAVIKMYIESLKSRNEKLQKEIKEDEELKQTYDAIDFMQKVATGEVEIAPMTDKGEIKLSDSNIERAKRVVTASTVKEKAKK